MDRNSTLQIQFSFMKNLNFLILIFISVVTMFGVRGCINDKSALDFLNYL